MIFVHKLRTQFRLIGRILIVNVEDFRLWPDKLGGIAMAVHAPVHIKRVHAVHERHLIHLPVTGRAAHAFVDVNAVVEINEVR
jgi:hypothetical protein